MKKLLFILAASCLTVSGYSQESSSIMFGQSANYNFQKHELSREQMDAMSAAAQSRRAARSVSRTMGIPAGDSSSWYEQWNQNAISGVSIGYYWVVGADSNIIDNFSPAVTAPYRNLFWHGMGMSFDPTDSSYSPTATVAQVPCYFGDNIQQYYVDSFFMEYNYIRNNTSASGDSLILEFVRTAYGTTADSGTYNLHFPSNAAFIPISADSQGRFATSYYDWNPLQHRNDIIMDSCKMPRPTAAYRYAFALDTLQKRDTLSDGLYGIQIPINPAASNNGILAGDGSYVTAYAYFKSGATYPLNTNLSAANCLYLFAGEPNGASVWMKQSAHNASHAYSGSFQCGLMASNQILYSAPGLDTSAFTWQGHHILIPSIAYAGGVGSTPPGFDVPEWDLHLYYLKNPLGVTNINKSIYKNSVYPNPATNTLNISFVLTQTTNVTVTLTDMMGQVVGSQSVDNLTSGKVIFNTATLADGIYIYTIEANGERTSGRVAISH